MSVSAAPSSCAIPHIPVMPTESTLSIGTSDGLHSICQICLNAIDDGPVVVSICGPCCPAVVCTQCFDTYVFLTLEATLSGILPRLRCPVCLVRLPRAMWRRHVTCRTRERYEQICAKACAFVPACCHAEFYTQLPHLLTDTATRCLEEIMDTRIHLQLPALRQHLHQFVAYELSARQLVAFLDDLVVPLGLTELSYQEFIDSIAVRIRDDERRASLIIAFHSVHKRVITRCCLMHFCFICHRQWNDTHEENPQGPCDSHDLVADNMVQCRACRVMLVKVEGCDAVQCPCGFRMRWSHELSVRKDVQYGRIPTTIDPLDLEMFELWDEWRGRVHSMIRYEVPSLRDLWRKRELDRGLVHSRGILRRLVQRYIWSRRFQTMYPDVVKHMRNAYRWRLIRTLRRHGFVRQKIYVWIAWRVCLKRIRCAVETYDEETVDENEVKLEMGLFGF